MSLPHASGRCWCGGTHSHIGAFLEELADQVPPAPVAGQRCTVCGTKMDPKLVAKTGWRTHPNCEETGDEEVRGD